jgi:hypothetical protein
MEARSRIGQNYFCLPLSAAGLGGAMSRIPVPVIAGLAILVVGLLVGAWVFIKKNTYVPPAGKR